MLLQYIYIYIYIFIYIYIYIYIYANAILDNLLLLVKLNIIVNKCVAFGCKTGYNSSLEDITVASFHFLLKNQQLLNYWIRFVNSDWVPSPKSVLCEKHFNENNIIRVIKCKLNWNLNPIPEIFSSECLKRTSTLPSLIVLRRPPKTCIYQEDELNFFSENDKITEWDNLNS